MSPEIRPAMTGEMFRLDALVSKYESFQISVRLIRVLVGALILQVCFGTAMVTIVSILILLLFVYMTITGMADFISFLWGNLGFGFVAAVNVSLIVATYSAFYLYRQVVSGSITARLLCSVALGVFLAGAVAFHIRDILAVWPILVSPGKGFNIDVPWVTGITDVVRDWGNNSKGTGGALHSEQIMSTALVCAVLAVFQIICLLPLGLILRGLFVNVWRWDPITALLFRDNNYHSQFWPGIRDLWSSCARFLGLYATSRYGKGNKLRIWSLALSAMGLEALTSLYIFSIDRPVRYLDLLAQTTAKLTQNDTVRAVIASLGIIEVIGIASLGFFLSWARQLRRFSQRFTVESFDVVTGDDSRAPILFLRSFKDDHLSLELAKPPFLVRALDPSSSPESIEFLVQKNLDYMGPLICIGNPKDQAPPPGAARKYLKDLEWQDSVLKLMMDSAYIIVGVDSTEGLLWEIESIKAHGHLYKTLFIFPPRQSSQVPLVEMLFTQFGVVIPAEPFWCNAKLVGMFSTSTYHLILITASRVTELEYELCLRYFISGRAQDGLDNPYARSITLPLMSAH